VNTTVECGVMSKNDEGEKINSTTFKSLVGSLRYMTFTRPDILFRVRLMSRFMETPPITYFKALKRILLYIKGIVDFNLLYEYSNSFELMSYIDNDWAEDIDDRKSTTCFVFYVGDTTFIFSSKKQHIFTLSTYKVEYVVTTTCVCHSIWLKRWLKELQMAWEKPIKIYMDNSSAIALAKNPVFHDKSKHINTIFHYLRDCITNKKVEVKYVKHSFKTRTGPAGRPGTRPTRAWDRSGWRQKPARELTRWNPVDPEGRPGTRSTRSTRVRPGLFFLAWLMLNDVVLAFVLEAKTTKNNEAELGILITDYRAISKRRRTMKPN